MKLEAKPKGVIRFDSVVFRYPGRRMNVLRRLDLTIEPNTSVAIVGHSGCGKSTIAKLLLRFYDSSQGSITLDGVDIREYNL